MKHKLVIESRPDLKLTTTDFTFEGNFVRFFFSFIFLGIIQTKKVQVDVRTLHFLFYFYKLFTFTSCLKSQWNQNGFKKSFFFLLNIAVFIINYLSVHIGAETKRWPLSEKTKHSEHSLAKLASETQSHLSIFSSAFLSSLLSTYRDHLKFTLNG